MDILSSQTSLLEVLVSSSWRQHAWLSPINLADLLKLVFVIFNKVSWGKRVTAPVAYELMLSHISVVHGLIAIWVFGFVLLVEN